MIAVVGSTMIDLVTHVNRMPDAGETLAGTGFSMGCGGKGANQAVAAAKLGSDVMMVARVGTDDFGRIARDNLRDQGVDVEHVIETEGTNGVAPIFVEPDGTNRVLIVKGVNDDLSPADVERAADRIGTCDLIVLQLEIPLDTVYAAIALGADRGVPVLLNPAPANPDLDSRKVATCEFFVPNETELGLLTGMPVDDPASVEKAARTLVESGPANVIVTLGEAGALWLARDEEATDKVRCVRIEGITAEAADTTGAGDAFIGCFAHHWAADRDVAAALAAANRYAADSVTRHGTQTSYADRVI